MSSIPVQPPYAPDNPNIHRQGPTSRSVAESTRISTSQQQSMDMTLVTAEGDKVTLSNSSRVHAAYGSVAGYMETGGTSAWAQGLSLSQNAMENFSITVEGDLSKEELKDIYQVISRLDKVMREMLDGDMDDAMHHALKLNKFDSIASLQANLQYSRSVIVEHQMVSRSQTSGTDEIDAPLADQPGLITMLDVSQLMEDLVEMIQESSVEPVNLLQPIEAVFHRLFENIKGMEDDDDTPKLQLAGLVKHDLLEKLWSDNDHDHDGRRAHGHYERDD